MEIKVIVGEDKYTVQCVQLKVEPSHRININSFCC